jgi:tRNA-2-methylthio-N6-dimethylallyladenosine synthase
MRALAEIDGLARIRYTTSHPRDMDDDLMRAHGEVSALMPFLHLPVQSGSDAILKAMNRGHGRDDFRRIIETLRGYRPDIALSSDFIVGFPGETDRDFADTLALIEEIGLVQAYAFKYSVRPGTPAASMDDQIAEEVKAERLAQLQALLAGQTRAFNTACVGCTFDVLLTGPGRHAGQLVGRSPYLQPVHVMADARMIGQVVPLRIIEVESNSLAAVQTVEVKKPA